MENIFCDPLSGFILPVAFAFIFGANVGAVIAGICYCGGDK